MRNYELIGVMSGTSMDGLDLAYVRFEIDETNQWTYSLIKAETFAYDAYMIEKFSAATQLNVPGFLQFDKRVGVFFAEKINDFIQKNKIDKSKINAIASHGHTTFHQPQNGFTSQIGCGSTISYLTGIPVINDFRTKDVIAGGQGAPLVPIGDLQLFNKEAFSFLNIGGISNISFTKDDQMIAFDICPGNLPLNKLVHSKGLNYDKNGDIASTGEINFFLLDLLNSLPFYTLEHPKSLGTEWLENEFYPLIKFNKDIENNLRTIIEHEAYQISIILIANNLQSVFITGGGTKNTFLIERIKHYYKGQVIIPSEEIVDFKEAIIFAFLGALYLTNKTNTLSSVTGARKNVTGGVYHVPN
jgi:anhydro-N-acetylmuramic acid kinase